MNLRTIFAISLFLIAQFIFAQKYTISGYVEDASSGEKLLGCNIFDPEKLIGTVTNNYGFYSITLPAGEYNMQCSFIGYKSIPFKIELRNDTVINLSMVQTNLLKEVEISASKLYSKVEESQMSIERIPIKTIKAMPLLLGETDIIKAIQLLPGVQSGMEGSSGLYVRGGGPDQNLILLDGVPVYNVNHLFGFFSVFNPDAINNVTLIKGGFPARYGGRLSAVLDIRMKEGNVKEFKGEGSIGLIASKLTLEGPIIKDKTSFIVSGRRTYIDFLSQPLIRYAAKREGVEKFKAGYYFYDLTGKINHKFSDKSRMYLSAYMGNDKVYLNMTEKDNLSIYDAEMGLRWGNITTALRWNYILSNKLFSNTTATYSRYKFVTGAGFGEESLTDNSNINFSYEYFSGIDDWSIKNDFDYLPNPNHAIKFGIADIYHTFKPGINVFNTSTGGFSLDTTYGNKNIYANEIALYAEDDMKIGSRLKVNAGLHYSGFYVNRKYYNSLQPRLSGSFLLTENLSVKAALSRMTQYIHLLTNTSIGLPTDLWLPVTDTIKPMQSMQYAVGMVYGIKEDYNISIEGFYKTMSNLIEYKEGASFFSSRSDWETNVEMGNGWAYGAEFLIEKKKGDLTGWIGYTLSWSERRFANISFGEKFPYRYDRRHDVGIVLLYKINDHIDAGLTWVYGTGNAVTLALEKYASLLSVSEYYYEQNIEYYEKRNSFRMKPYHRMDVGINFYKKMVWGERKLSIGLYNAYNRKNPFFMMFEERNGETKLMQYSLFPIIPFLSYNFSF